MSEKTSQASDESTTSETAQLVQVFHRIYKSYQNILEKERKTNDVRAILKIFIEAKILEERAGRNIEPLFDNTIGSAWLDHNDLSRFLHSNYRKALEEIENWLETTITEKLKAAGFQFNRIEPPGINLEIQTLTKALEKEIAESRRIKDSRISYKGIPNFLQDISVILFQLGFNCLSVETAREGKLYYIKAFMILIEKETAIALLEFGKFAATYERTPPQQATEEEIVASDPR